MLPLPADELKSLSYTRFSRSRGAPVKQEGYSQHQQPRTIKMIDSPINYQPMPPVNILTDGEVLAQVRALAMSQRVYWTSHAEQRLVQRGFDKETVRACLANGNFSERPFIPNKSGDLQYQFALEATIDGEYIKTVATLKSSSSIVVITVIDDK